MAVDFAIAIAVQDGNAAAKVGKLEKTLAAAEVAAEDLGKAASKSMATAGTAADSTARATARLKKEIEGLRAQTVNRDLAALTKSFDGVTQAIRREADVLERIKGPMREYAADLRALDMLQRRGAISAAEYARELSKIRGRAGVANPAAAVSLPAAPARGGMLAAASSGLDKVGGAFGVSGGALAGGAAVAGAIALSDAYTTLQNKLKVVVGEGEALRETSDELYGMSQKLRIGWGDLTAVYTRVALATKDVGISGAAAMQFTEQLGMAVKLSGASAQEASNGMVQLSQGLASGTLRGDELRSVLEQLPAVADVIAKGLGVTRGQLRKLGEDGKITTEQVIGAFAKADGELREKFGRTVPTVGEHLIALKDSLTRVVGELFETLHISELLGVAFKILVGVLDAVVAVVRTIATLLSELVDMVGRIIDALPTGALDEILAKALAAARAMLALDAANKAAAASAAFNTFDESQVFTASVNADGTAATDADAAIIKQQKAAYEGITIAVDAYAASVKAMGRDQALATGDARRLEQMQIKQAEALMRLNEITKSPDSAFFAKVEERRAELTREATDQMEKLRIEVAATTGAMRELAQVELDNLIPAVAAINKIRGAIEGKDEKFAKRQKEITDAANTGATVAWQTGGRVQPLSQAEIDKALAQAKIEIYGDPSKGKGGGTKTKSDAERMLESIRGPMDRHRRDVAALAQLWEMGKITQAEYAAGMDKTLGNDLTSRLFVGAPAEARPGEAAPEMPRIDTSAIDTAVAHGKAVREALITPTQTYRAEVAALNNDLQFGAITLDEYNAAMVRAGSALDAATPKVISFATQMDDGISKGLEEVARNFTDFGSLLSTTIVSAVTGLEDVLLDFVVTGKASFKDLADSVLRDLTRIILRMAIVKGIEAATGSPIGALTGFATGGSFMVGGTGGTDSQPVAFMASPNERVTIETPSQQRASRSADPGSGGGSGGGGAPQQIRVINMFDPAEMAAALSTPAGERAILNVISANRSKLRGALQ